MKSTDDDDEIAEKDRINREHMRRVSLQMAAEEEALKFSRIIRGVDKKKYKDIRYVASEEKEKEEIPDEKKLTIMRWYQFLIGFMGFVGVIVVFWSFYDPVLRLSISKNFKIEIDLIFIGSILAGVGVLGIIGFQHKHDKISDRINASQRTGIVVRKRIP